MEATDENSSQLPAYTALKWGEFVANPHLLYNLCPGSSNRREDNVINMAGIWTNPNNREFKVESIEELERLSNDLLTKPILFHVKLQHQKAEYYGVMEVHKTWKGEFAVLVNTRHPGIREVLTHKLLEITQHMQEGKEFCLQLDFGPAMKQWYSWAVDSQPDLFDIRRSSNSGHMEISIHNYSTPVDYCMNPLCIVGCFPFWLLLGGPCCCIHRIRKCINDSHHFRNLPVVLITGVSMRVTVRQNMPSPGPPQDYNPQGPPEYYNPQGPSQYYNPQRPPQHYNPQRPPQHYNPQRPPQYYNPQGPPTYQPRVGPGNYDPTPPPPYPGNNC
nr:uncharacterized protein LOC105329109 isoform X2 [Crassostrea gigas]